MRARLGLCTLAACGGERVCPVAWSADGGSIAMPFHVMSAAGRHAPNVEGEILGFAP